MSGFGTFYAIAMMATAAALLTLSVVVLWFRKKQPYYLYWSAVCCCLAVLWLSIVAAPRLAGRPDAVFLIMRVGFSAGTGSAAAFLAFALSFLGRLDRARWATRLSAASGAALLLLFWGTDLLVGGFEGTDAGIGMPEPGPLLPLYGLYTAIHGFAPVVLFTIEYRKATGRARLKLGYLLTAMAVMAVGAVGSLLPTLERGSLLAFVPSLLMILAPTLVTYAIVRHQLWDIRTVFHRTALWAVASLVVALPVYLLVRLFGAELGEHGAPAAVLVTAALMALFGLHFRIVQPWLDHRFARRKHDASRVADRFNHRVVRLQGADALAVLLAETIRSTLYPWQVWVAATDEQAGPRSSGAASRFVSWAALDGETRRWLVAADRVVDAAALSEAGAEPADALAEIASLAGCDVQVIVPLVQEGRLVGVVALGEKQNLRAYTKDDVQLLEHIRPAATVAFANAQLYDQLQELTGTLEQRVAQRTAELEQVNDKLRELDRQRIKFFANITHELRTPLTLILGPLEDLLVKLRHRGGPDGMVEDLATMHRNALRLLRQINALLELARHDAGELRLRPTALRLGEVLDRVVQNFEPIARRKGVVLRLDPLPEGGDDSMIGDTDKLTLVLNNLLGNALKFTDPGGRVTVSLGADEHRLSIAVRDTGIGIAPEEQARIFDRFAQVDAGTTRRYEGAGIGLSLVKELVELHQGTVVVESEPGEGSEFRLELPRELLPEEGLLDRRRADVPTAHQRRAEDRDPLSWAAPAAELDGEAWLSVAEPASSERRPVGPGGGARLVVAEDNPDMRGYLERRLGERHDVTACADGQEALEACRERPPDLVLADVMMPRMSGLDLCLHLKADERTRGVPVLLLTARKGLDRTLEGFDVGADDYVTKPFNFQELLARIQVQLRLVELGRELARHQKGEVLNLVAAGLAHEVRNPVNAILNAVRPLLEPELLGADGPEAERAKLELLQAVLESAERIDQLCADLLDVGRPHLEEVASWRIGEAVGAALRLLRHKGGGLETDVTVALGHRSPVYGRTAQLNQVLMNLLDNAVRAAGDGGRVVVETTEGDGCFRLEVRDSGGGLEPGSEDRIFDPLFTTHGHEGSQGLGLYICRRIVEGHGGRIFARAGDDGAELVVELPLPADAAEATDQRTVS